jgi:hypothetical protein
MKIGIATLLMLVCLSYTQFISAADTHKTQLSEEKWKKITKDIDYTENFKEVEPKEESHKPRRSFHFNPSIMRAVVIILVVGLLVFIFYLVLKHFLNFFDERVKNESFTQIIENLEENIHDADFELLLKQAIDNKEFKLAVRILYLQAIKQLSDKQLIIWKREKTNSHYVREMSTDKQGRTFSFLTLVYEQSWFSNYHVDQERYSIISEQFFKFLNNLN